MRIKRDDPVADFAKNLLTKSSEHRSMVESVNKAFGVESRAALPREARERYDHAVKVLSEGFYEETEDLNEHKDGSRVVIRQKHGGMKEFEGKTGTVIGSEKDGRHGPVMYRVKLDSPVEIPGVGHVSDDLWAGKHLSRSARAKDLDEANSPEQLKTKLYKHSNSSGRYAYKETKAAEAAERHEQTYSKLKKAYGANHPATRAAYKDMKDAEEMASNAAYKSSRHSQAFNAARKLISKLKEEKRVRDDDEDEEDEEEEELASDPLIADEVEELADDELADIDEEGEVAIGLLDDDSEEEEDEEEGFGDFDNGQ
jgi:ribosomal protein L21E